MGRPAHPCVGESDRRRRAETSIRLGIVEAMVLESPGSLFLGPDGHGGMLAALAKSGCLADAQRRGVAHFFYGQIDNPLLQVCDELFLGSHMLAGSEMTTQVVRQLLRCLVAVGRFFRDRLQDDRF